MGILLREALSTICVNNQWSYAVFWKIGCQNSSLLIWEECYHETSLSSLPTRISGFNSSDVITRGCDEIDILTNRMMLNNRIILVGEGLVGRAAFTGHPQWILANSFNRDLHPPEVVNEMLLQFSAGIQTVAVIPVVPHGVVQLGSSLPIMENLGFVNDVKSLIMQLGCIQGALLSENYGTHGSADLIGVPVSRSIQSQPHKIFNPSDLVSNTDKHHLSSSDDAKAESSGVFGGQNTSGFLASEVIMSSNPDAWLNQNFSSTFDVVGMEQHIPQISETCDDIGSKPSSGNDLFDILGLDKAKIDGNGPDMKTAALTKEMSDLMNIQEMGSEIYSGYDDNPRTTDHLLQAVVSGACLSSKQISEDTSESCRTTLTTSNSTFPGGFFEIPKPVKLTEFGKDRDLGSASQTPSVHGSQISSWVEQAHGLKCESSVSTGYSRMNKNETPKPGNRKRLKPGENPRPRPKDRQMIQDRVKELREIIPNGAKCSIDALLERTIKHMLFLQNVNKHADKLKPTDESKIMKDEGGSTWAFEVRSRSLVCPIVVEDLSVPRCFQVEMLCEHRGLFLEIADWIRGLGLTILKGVMETRNDKIWARFAVEANRDVTRMEIFMQLVNIFEQTTKSVGPTNNILDHMNATVPVTGGCPI